MDNDQIHNQSEIVEQLRLRACPPEGEYLESDHGHSDCYLEREAADKIEQLRSDLQTMVAETQLLISLITAWADAEDAMESYEAVVGPWTEWDRLYARYQDAQHALRKAVGR